MSSEESGLSGLQFDRVEPINGAASACVPCGVPIAATYYAVNGHTVCPSCADQVTNNVQEPLRSDYLRAALYGAGAAFAGALVYFAIVALSGYEIGLIAVAVGWAVGKAVQRGSRGIGGRKLQIMAVVITYFSIVGSYVPLIIKSAIDNPPGQKQVAASGRDAGNGKQPATPPVSQPTEFSVSAMIVGVAILFAYTLVLPFMQGLSSIIGLFIIFIGLFEAWKLNKRVPIVVEGPLEAAPTEPAT